MDSQIPIVVTDGDTAHGEIVRGDVLLIHYDEAAESKDYALDSLDAAKLADAPQAVIESLIDILVSDHGVSIKDIDPDSIEGVLLVRKEGNES